MFDFFKKGAPEAPLFKNKKNVIHKDVFDDDLFKIAFSFSKKLKEQKEKLTKKGSAFEYPQIKELQQDAFSALYKGAPHIVDAIDVDPEYLLNQMVLGEAMKTPQYHELRMSTKLDQLASNVATEQFAEDLEELLQQKREELKQEMEDLRKLQEELQRLQDEAGGDESGGEADGGEGEDEGEGHGQGQGQGEGEGEAEGEGTPGKGKNKKRHSIEEVKRKIEEKMASWKQGLLTPSERKQIKNSLTKASKEVAAHNEFIEAWGLGSDPTFMRSDPKQKLEKVEKLRQNSKLRKMGMLLGKLRPLARFYAKEKVKRIPSQIQDMVPGNNLSRTIPQDLMLMLRPSTKRLFLDKFTSKKLREYEHGSKRRKGKGPIVVCIDESGSMSGENEIWAKAVSLALIEISRSQRRDLVVIQFSGGDDERSLLVTTFGKNEPWNADKIIKYAETFLDGGTNFVPPLAHARKLMDKDKSFHKADIVFITDGECAVPNSFLNPFLAWKKEKAVSIYGILIDMSSHNSTTVKEFADPVVFLKSLRDETASVEAAKGIFAHLT